MTYEGMDLVFEISNAQEEYARCLQVIEMIENGGCSSAADRDLLSRLRYKSVNRTVKVEDIDRIQTEPKEKYRANIRDLLSDLVLSERIKECYIWKDGKYEPLRIKEMRRDKRFSPIFRIARSEKREENVSYWRQSVQNFIRTVYSHVPMGEADSEYTVNYFLPHIAPRSLKRKYPKDIWSRQGESRDIRLLNNFVECFCGRDHKSSQTLTEKRYLLWKSQELFEKVKNIPLLAMYIFCKRLH